ncbi:RND transporter MFP subunit [Jannaschia pagri]|uniref:RND transporter MFP subunit n=2 Tax=Jannaschia pagri TaxID=2829797 RepID=A0ABQ4NR16_9RHOB|nr:efflux RND transporter periplasmic adaptor subunit [Jannaschia sp. AI_61]GIT93018.1 RND transporter MFP subunit [Jannaschia sp. AI_61]GIT96853.1 RND transporter MFP subunit [Jannaschia sp. AI_62]
MLSAALRTFVTLIVVAVAVAAGIVGYGALATRAAAVDEPAVLPPTSVRVASLTVQDTYLVTREVSGQVEAPQQVALALELGGTLAEVAVREGDTLAAGDVVARADIRALTAERARIQAGGDAIRAELDLAQRTNARQTELRSRGFATDQRVDDTSLTVARLEARLAEVEAGLEAIDVSLSKAEVRAPFAGTVGARLMDVGAVAGPGAPIVTLLEAGAQRFRVGLPPDLAANVSLGDEAEISVAGHTISGRLTRLSPDLDPATRSRTALFEVTSSDVTLAAGATGQIAVTQTLAGQGAWVPLSALRPGPGGSWTLLTVEDARVTVEAATVLHLSGDRAYIRGTFADGTDYIPDGGHRVVPGQTVAPQSEVIAWAR